MSFYKKQINYLNPPDDLPRQRLVRWPPKDIVALLDVYDQELVDLWLGGKENSQYQKEQLISARLAEKVAILYFSNLRYEVVDASITQIKAEQLEWRTCDLLIDGKIPVDVKNSRTSFYGRKQYVDHCIPKFKQDRQNQEVIIGSVLSPNLSFDQIIGKAPISSNTSDFIYLGETTLSRIQLLENEFHSDRVKVNVRNYRGGNSFIPAWAFDYLIRKQPSHKKTDLVPGIPKQITQGIDLTTRGSIRSKLPDALYLTDNHKDFYRRLIKHSNLGISLPVLYLSIWEDFFEKIADRSPRYSPVEYYYAIYHSSANFNNPLGMTDPLGIIFELIHILALLKKQSEVDWNSFDQFILKGQDSLVGITKSHRIVTLIAYCGGIIADKRKCFNGPLIIGKNKTCDKCNKLICRKCGYCSSYCPRHVIEENTTDANRDDF